MAAFAALAPMPVAAASCALHEPLSDTGVIAAENSWIDALTHKDAQSLGCRLAPDFKDTSWRGQIRTRDDMLDALVKASANPISLSDVTVQRVGRFAIARGVNTVPQPDGGARIRFTDVFVYKQGYWRAVSAQETPERSAP